MLRRRALPVLIGVGVLLSATGGWAQAAAGHPTSAPGWRPVSQQGPANGVTYVGGFVATGPKDAWSTWSSCDPCGGANPKVDVWLEHWAGLAWRRVSVPSDIRPFVGFVNGMAASSPSDLWLFTTGRAAHWNGKHWGIMKIPSWVVRYNLSGDVALTVADFGPGNLWVFSSGIDSFKPTVPFAARYNGHRWTKAVLPAIPGLVSVVGPDDIWASAVSGINGKPLLMHWNGTSWSKMSQPKPAHVPAHYSAQVGGLLAVGPSDVWMEQDIEKGLGISRTQYLLHWNGSKWSYIPIGFPASYIQNMAPDGHGGLWLSDVEATRAQLRYLAHFNPSAGRWGRQLVPPPPGMGVQQLLTLNQIPGTSSMWAAGGVFPVHSTTIVIGEIWKYGP